MDEEIYLADAIMMAFFEWPRVEPYCVYNEQRLTVDQIVDIGGEWMTCEPNLFQIAS